MIDFKKDDTHFVRLLSKNRKIVVVGIVDLNQIVFKFWSSNAECWIYLVEHKHMLELKIRLCVEK